MPFIPRTQLTAAQLNSFAPGTRVLLADGVRVTPALAFDAEKGTGIIRSANGKIGFTVGGALVAEIDSTGFVIVGTNVRGLDASSITTGTIDVARLPPGTKGDTGAKGAPGDTGATGTTGQTGPRGIPGTASAKGDKGDTGDKGEKGDPGDDGATGTTGKTGVKGDAGAPGLNGAVGERGPRGFTGVKGDDGATGTTGDTGVKGDAGAPGLNGGTGARGPRGFTGDDGNRGATGSTGVAGQRGPQGVKGNTGAQGPSSAPASGFGIGTWLVNTSSANMNFAGANRASVVQFNTGGNAYARGSFNNGLPSDRRIKRAVLPIDPATSLARIRAVPPTHGITTHTINGITGEMVPLDTEGVFSGWVAQDLAVQFPELVEACGAPDTECTDRGLGIDKVGMVEHLAAAVIALADRIDLLEGQPNE